MYYYQDNPRAPRHTENPYCEMVTPLCTLCCTGSLVVFTTPRSQESVHFGVQRDGVSRYAWVPCSKPKRLALKAFQMSAIEGFKSRTRAALAEHGDLIPAISCFWWLQKCDFLRFLYELCSNYRFEAPRSSRKCDFHRTFTRPCSGIPSHLYARWRNR